MELISYKFWEQTNQETHCASLFADRNMSM